MKKQGKREGRKNGDSLLRGAAEEKLAQSLGVPPEMKEKTLEELVHELQVHQIELEMQNEELRRVSLALEVSRDKYVDLYDFAPVGYFTFTPKALITEVSLTGAALLGIGRQKLINARFRKFVAPQDAERWDRHFVSVLESEKPFRGPGKKQSCEIVLKREDGSMFHARLDSIRVDLPTEQAGVSGWAPVVRTAVSDITERKRAEETLADRTVKLEHANRELVALNAELDEFTNMASHDLQEPLRTLTAFSDLLREDLGNSLPERAARDIEFITDAAKRMQKLIQDLLALSRAGRVAKKREKVSLGDCADQALEALAVRVKETGAKITRDELPEVWGDSTLLTQFYQNLIGNALKFSGEQPPVIRLTAEGPEGSMVFGVKDNGIGIEPQYAQQIFQPFRRLHSQAEYEGSGIGLAICRKIVERHGGKIWVESEPQKGAHFRFTLSERKSER
jgi:chemotaxis family two-component system sensor kinase Cph1